MEKANRLAIGFCFLAVLYLRCMKRKFPLGRLITFDGLDGSGKSTQAKLLLSHLEKKGYKTAKIDFPQYGQKSAGLVEEYLKGKYGKADEVGPYAASLFYACDRYDASFKIRKWLEKGMIVVSDRYVGSNIGHQGGKIKDKEERKKYLEWLYHLEYDLFAIPKPDLAFIFKTSPELSRKMSPRITDDEKKKKRKLYLGRKTRDIHEKDLHHLTNALSAYLEIAKEFPHDFLVIDCLDEKGRWLAPDEIQQKVWQIVQKYLKNFYKL